MKFIFYVRNKYGPETSKGASEYLKLLEKLNNCKQAINFINKCRSNEVDPAFTQLRVANEDSNKNSAFMKSISRQISDEELKNKWKRLNKLKNEKIKIFNGPLFNLSHIDEFIMKTIFWSKVRILVNEVKQKHNKKLEKLGINTFEFKSSSKFINKSRN